MRHQQQQATRKEQHTSERDHVGLPPPSSLLQHNQIRARTG